MQALNSQRKAFLDMVAWSEGTDNGRQPTRNHGYDVIVGGELFTDYSDHPRKLVTRTHAVIQFQVVANHRNLLHGFDTGTNQRCAFLFHFSLL